MATKPLPGLDVPIARADPATQTWYEYFQSLWRTIIGYESAWTSYTPVVTSSIGTIGSYTVTGKYKTIGKTVFLNTIITITAQGTAAGGSPSFTLPVANSGVQVGVAREVSVVGWILWAQFTSSLCFLGRYDNTGIITTGHAYVTNAVYESV